MKRTLGVCYYPEHWDPNVWVQDAKNMVEAGITWVRIGEFAWSRIEPSPGQFEFEWLDQAITILGDHGLKVILGTPTATPPRWMIDKHPDMLAHDENGHIRKFGSRRHYCFSHDGYREECRRITRILAQRYGANPHILAWQTDNEYDCHDTVISYSPAARRAFQDWCAQRYQSTDAMNRAWGNVFWSMDYDRFDQVDLPNQTVTEPNPAHVLAFRRFSSDQVVVFNQAQCDVIRAHSTAPIVHNFMGRITSFDHYQVGADLDIASWDAYPMGFLLDRGVADEVRKRDYLRQGDPDFQAFHHDLYRACGQGRWWIMEQQPGPVNWAPWNPAPLPGMQRLWAWEAFAHGAETVCYFRWRQAPFAQEQMHAGLMRPNDTPAAAFHACKQVGKEMEDLSEVSTAKADVALVFDYDSAYAWETQRQGCDFDYFELVFCLYRALRRLGINVDVVPKTVDPTAYKVTFAPGLFTIPDAWATCQARLVLGPRAGSKTEEFSIPDHLGPGIAGFDCKVNLVETLPPFAPMPLKDGGAFVKWREDLETTEPATHVLVDGAPAVITRNNLTYLAGWPDEALWRRLLLDLTREVGIDVEIMPKGVRRRDSGQHRFYFNYGSTTAEIANGTKIPAAGVHWSDLS